MPEAEHSKKPLLIYDGACGFCKRWITRWQSQTGERVTYKPFQEVADPYPDIPRESFEGAVHFVDTDGRVSQGAEAVFKTLSVVPRKSWLLGLYKALPPFKWVTDAFYGFVARHRAAASWFTKLFWGNYLDVPRYRRTTALYLRALGVIYLIAIASFWVQADGLVGSQGITPMQPYVDAIENQLGARAYTRVPTLFYISASDTAISAVCLMGVAAAVLLIIGFVPTLCLVALWAIYLSITIGGQRFMSFQWDTLLVEAGFLSIFLLPPRWRLGGRAAPEPSTLMLFLERFLLFKLMFASGLVKFSSGDVSWWPEMTAMTYHYETTCLPTWTSFFAHQLPVWVQKISCAIMFLVELVVPLMIFMPRRMRLFAFVALVGLQAMIAATGNYAFFNYLTMVLCIPLLDDHVWTRRCVADAAPVVTRVVRWGRRVWSFAVVLPVFVVIFSMSSMILLNQFDGFLKRFNHRMQIEWPESLQVVHKYVGPFRSVNGYGLFAHMTKERPEIIIEGSHDGKQWKAYTFKWKPGDPSRRPRFVAPHQPRVDWQMWFAALGNYEGHRWFINFVARLVEQSPPVLDLIEHNPFPDEPPKHIRAVLYDYQFNDIKTWRETGEWWKREPLRLYCPVLTRRDSEDSE